MSKNNKLKTWLLCLKYKLMTYIMMPGQMKRDIDDAMAPANAKFEEKCIMPVVNNYDKIKKTAIKICIISIIAFVVILIAYSAWQAWEIEINGVIIKESHYAE